MASVGSRRLDWLAARIAKAINDNKAAAVNRKN